MSDALDMSIRELVEGQRVLWVLVNPDGTARVAVPFGMQLRDLYEEPSIPSWVDPAGSPLEREMACVARFLATRSDWAAIVSVLRQGSQGTYVQSLLPSGRWRELAPVDHADLGDLEMSIPMGPWADPASADLYMMWGGES